MKPSKTAKPCGDCGTKGGYIRPGRKKPDRYAGEPFGFTADLCRTCSRRHQKRVRDGKPLVVKKRLTHAQRYAAERPGVLARLAALRAAKIRRYESGDLSNPTMAELDAILAHVA